MTSKEENVPRLLGRLHTKDNSVENLFICSCGNSIWVRNLVESTRKTVCNKCSCSYILEKKEGKYTVSRQGTLW